MRGLIVWKRRRNALMALPVALLGLLLVQLVLLPAHGVPTHEAAMSTVGASSIEQPAKITPNHDVSGHGHADESHGPHDGEPVCHAVPLYGDVVLHRSWDDDFPIGAGLLFALTAGMLVASLLRSRPPSCHRRWRARPLWRPAGADLLKLVCLARI